MMALPNRRVWLVALAVVAGSGAGLPVMAQETPRLAPVYDRSGVVESAASSSELEKRVARLEKLMENQALVDMLMRLDSLQSDTQDLRGQIEDVMHELDSLKQRQRDLYLDMDRRLRQAELAITKMSTAPSAVPPAVGMGAASSSAAAAATAVAAPVVDASAAAVAAAAPVVVEADPAAERAAYQKAFDELKQGRYEQAITAFSEFLKRYPTGEYAGNAQYWLGEANYVTRHFRVAEQEFKKVLQQYPESGKVADAMLKLGYTYYELGEWDAARQILTEVVSKNPGSSVARLAENRLQKMRLEGR